MKRTVLEIVVEIVMIVISFFLGYYLRPSGTPQAPIEENVGNTDTIKELSSRVDTLILYRNEPKLMEEKEALNRDTTLEQARARWVKETEK